MTKPNETVTLDNIIINSTVNESSTQSDTMMIVHSIIATVGIVTNPPVVVVFLNHKKLKHKIPNICIINQIRLLFYLPQMKFRKGNVFTPVCDSVHRGRYIPPWAETPSRETPPADTPPGQTPP